MGSEKKEIGFENIALEAGYKSSGESGSMPGKSSDKKGKMSKTTKTTKMAKTKSAEMSKSQAKPKVKKKGPKGGKP